MNLRNIHRSSPAGIAALTVALASTAAYPQAFQGTPAPTAGSFTFDRATPGQDTITVTGVLPTFPSQTAAITWSAIPTGNPATFLPAGSTAIFQSASGLPSYILTNQLDPGASPSALFDGAPIGNDPDATIEFETIGGEPIIFGANASASMPHLVLRAATVTVKRRRSGMRIMSADGM